MLKGCREGHSISSYKDGYRGSEPVKDISIPSTHLGSYGAPDSCKGHVNRSSLPHTCPTPHFVTVFKCICLPNDRRVEKQDVGVGKRLYLESQPTEEMVNYCPKEPSLRVCESGLFYVRKRGKGVKR